MLFRTKTTGLLHFFQNIFAKHIRHNAQLFFVSVVKIHLIFAYFFI